MNKRRACAGITHLPNDYILDIISLTSPRDAYNFALTSTSFQWVVDSEFLWQSFLPSDYATILSRAVAPVVYTSKKDLFFKLSQRHVLIDEGTMSFGLDRSSGAKCYMVSTSLLKILCAEPAHIYWQFSLPDSRFAKVLKPITQYSMLILGDIDVDALSQKTRYGTYLVYKLTETADVSRIGISGQQSLATVCKYCNERSARCELCEMGEERGDGWKEMQIGEFYNDNGRYYRNMVLMVKMIDSHQYHKGIILEGIEIRPKH